MLRSKAKRTDAHIFNAEPRQLIYPYNNTDKRSGKHCYSGKKLILLLSVRV